MMRLSAEPGREKFIAWTCEAGLLGECSPKRRGFAGRVAENGNARTAANDQYSSQLYEADPNAFCTCRKPAT
jgi:hypothetical protein